MVTPHQLAKKKVFEFLFMVLVIIEHTITISVFMLGIFALNWLAIRLGLGACYPVSLLRDISEYALLGMYTVFVIAGIIMLYKILKNLEVN